MKTKYKKENIKTELLAFRLTPVQFKALKAVAEKNLMSIQEFVRFLISRELMEGDLE